MVRDLKSDAEATVFLHFPTHSLKYAQSFSFEAASSGHFLRKNKNINFLLNQRLFFLP